MRQLSLHVSALSDAEFDLFTASLSDLVLSNEFNAHAAHDDAYYERVSVGVREARAWLRGRYPHILAADIDSILKLFYTNLGQTDTLSGGQFFAVLRLVVHVEGGKAVDRALAFVQAHPNPGTTSRPASPPKRQSRNLPPTPVHQVLQTTTPRHSKSASSTSENYPISDTAPNNPFYLPASSSVDSYQPHQLQNQTENSHNPFVPRVSYMVPSASHTDDLKTPTKLPPLPPRKTPSIPAHSQTALVPPPRHGSIISPNSISVSPSKSTIHSIPPAISPRAVSPSSSTPPLPPASTPIPKTGTSSHVTSTLIRQSLHASKVAQTMKKAEEHLEKERVLQVLKSSAPAASSPPSPASGGVTMASRNRSNSPTKWVYLPPSSSGTGSTTYTSASDERAPPLPRRRSHNPPPSSPPISSSSLEQVALAGASHSMNSTPPTSAMMNTAFNTFGRPNSNHRRGASPFRTPAVTTAPRTDSPAGSPSRSVVDLPTYNGPPPVHPDRKPTHLTHPHLHSSLHHRQMPSISPNDAESFEIIHRPDTTEPNAPQTSPSAESPTSRMVRSNSMHHPSPPPPVPPPLRRKRPESVQVFGSSFSDSPRNAGARSRDGGDGPASLSRRVSLNSSLPGHVHEACPSHSQSNSYTGSTVHHDSPLGNIQRTLATLQPKLDALQLQPRLEKARYKAEAGLSRRGFVRDGKVGKSGLEGEEEEGLMEERGRRGWDDVDRMPRYGDAAGDGYVSERNGEGEVRRHGRTNGSVGHEDDVWDQGEGVGVERDNLKWPTGEGWKPL